MLCFKGEGGLSREEIETEIDAALFARLEHLIGKPLIHKERRGYQLPGGLTLEVNCVDPDLPTAFWYAEVEFETEPRPLPGTLPAAAWPTTCTRNAPASPAAAWANTGCRHENKEAFSLRAKSRLRRLRSDTRLRAQPRRGKRKFAFVKFPAFALQTGGKRLQ